MTPYIRQLALQMNQPRPLVDYLIPLVGDKKQIKILDVGSGPFPKTGQLLEGVAVELHCCDRKPFPGFWEELGQEPFFPVEIQDMEKLSYPDESFDIVHCVNALDHTPDALAALKELIRVSSEWVYIDLNLDQRMTFRKRHYWDAKADGRLVNPDATIDLKDFGFAIEYLENKPGKPHRNQIIARLRK